MKKELLLSTAIAGAGLVLFGAPAFAGNASASKTELTIGGSLDFQVGIGSDDTNSRNTRDYDAVTDTEIHFDFRGVPDNGITFGAKIETEADEGATGNVDEGNIYIFGDFGRIEMGDQDGAEDQMIYDAGGTQSGVGGIDGDVDRWFVNTSVATSFPDIADTSDNTKITYYTPRVSGVQAGVSFTPALNSTGLNVANQNAGSFENHIGVGVNYTGMFSGASVKIGAVYSHADADPVAGAVATDDISAFAIGTNIGFGGFTIGGSYGNNGDSGGTDDSWFWDIGVGYGMGPWSVSAGYLKSQAKLDAAGSPDEEFSNIAVGAGYQVAPGLYTYADLLFAESDDGSATAPGNDNKATILLLGTVVSF
jgi:hypothetical protein